MFAPTSPPIAAPAAKNGLSDGAVPSALSRRIDAGEVGVVGLRPAELVIRLGAVPNGLHGRFCSWPRRPTSPMKM